MELGLKELRLSHLRTRFKWRGRRYAGGLMQGLGVGLILAAVLVRQGAEGPAVVLCGLTLAFFLVAVGNIVVGRPPKEIA